ncbi:MAG: winged helix-turn-helix domain-containing protein [Bryobacteraceae bacterium]
MFRGEDKIHITPKPFGVLEYLARNRHRVVSKTELLEKVWGEVREPGTVEQAIRQLRRAMGDGADNPRYIGTVAGEGYRLIAEAPAPAPEARRKPKGFPRRLVAGVAMLIASVGAFFAFRHFHRPSQLASASLTRSSVVALDPKGDVLWTHSFSAGLRDPAGGEMAWTAQVVDLNGDGAPEVLVNAGFADGSASDRLLCFSSRGKPLWNYQPEVRLRFGDWAVKGPWIFDEMLLVPENGRRSVYLAVSDNTWWPSFLVKVSPTGAHQIVFVSSGNVRAMHRIQTKSGTYILAAGINNEYHQAFLAILRQEGPAAMSLQSDGSQYQCTQGCPAGRPYRFILFPRSELSLASDVPYNIAIRIDDRPDGITVSTDETGGTGGARYDFTREIQPVRVSWGDNWGQLHRQFERQGLIKHSFERCPELTTPAILKVCDQNGKWSTMSVPRRPWPY